jgi:hypothetical protein
VRPTLIVDQDKAALIHSDCRAIQPRNIRIGLTSDRHQHPVEKLFRVLGVRTLQRRANPIGLLLHSRDLRFQQNRLRALIDSLGKDFDQIPVGSGQEAGGHFDNGHLTSERGIHTTQLETDVSAAHNQQRLGDGRKIKSRRRIPHSGALKSKAADSRGP